MNTLNEDSISLSLKVSVEKFVDLRVDFYVGCHFIFAGIHKDLSLHCILLDQFDCNWSSVSCFGSEDTEWNQFV